MHYQEYAIAASLRPFEKVIWSMETNARVFDSVPVRILPDTCVELVVHFSDPYKPTFSDNTNSIQQQSFVVAQMKSFVEIQPHGKTGFISVRFSATGAYHFIGMPLKEIANRESDLCYVWKNLSEEIEERIGLANNNHQRSRIIQEYLLLQLSKNGKSDPGIDYFYRNPIYFNERGINSHYNCADAH